MSERKDYHNMKKFLSVLLTLAMICMMFVTPALAESAEANTITITDHAGNAS